MTNLLDLRTVLLDFVISAAISAAVMVSLYIQNRKNEPDLVYWPAGFILQFLGILMIALRGLIPDFFSIWLGNFFLIAQAFFILLGLGKFLKRTIPVRINLLLMAVYLVIIFYYTYAHPLLLGRNLAFSIALFLFCFHGAWVVFRYKGISESSSLRMAGVILAGYCLFSAVRIFFDLAVSPGADFISSTLPDTLVIITYQMLSIGLTFTLFLMINRRLVANLEEDIEKRIQVEESLRESEEEFSKAFHNIPDILVISQAGTASILAVNSSFEKISGYTAKEAVGKSALRDLNLWVNPADREAFSHRLRSERRVEQFETLFRKKNGGVINALISGETIRLRHGECFLLIIRDITQRKRIEQAEKEQRDLAEALRDTATALTSTLKSDEVLDRILDNLGRVVPNDTANFMLLDEDGQLVVVRTRGYAERGLTDLAGTRCPMEQLPLLKKVAETGQPMAFPDVDAEPEWLSRPAVQWIKSYAAAPIRARGRIIGFLNLDSTVPGFFKQEMADRLQAFADQASTAIENARLYEEVHGLAVTDPLTGLLNRRGLFQLGEREVLRSQRFQHPLAALMVDIDHFKKVNDSFGHATGDRVLTVLAACLRSQVRNVDLLVRYGGEEFTILLPETELNNALAAAERIRKSVEELEIPAGPDSTPLKITVSLGVVMLSPGTPDLANLLERADQALYKAKRKGRNRVEKGEDPIPAK